MQIRVYYEDTDTGGIVYYSNYLNFCERARSEAFFSNGFSPVLNNGYFVVRKIKADFYKSAKLGDLLDIKTKLLKVNAASLEFKQIIYFENKKLFELDVTLAFMSFENKIQKIDKETANFLLSIFTN